MANIHPYTPAFTSCFAVSEESFPIHIFGDSDRKITCVAPLYSTPSVTMSGNVLVNPTNHTLLLDSNILSFADNNDKHEQVEQLFRWASSKSILVSPLVAILEQFNQDLPYEESAGFIRRKVLILNERYTANIDIEWMEYALFRAPFATKQNKDYVGILADFFIVVRYFYHKKSTFEKKCKLLAKLMHEQFPQLTIAYYIACLYFYVSANHAIFPDAKGKCQSDMTWSEDKTKAYNDAYNFAFDISLITGSSMPFTDDNGAFLIPYIATADNGLAFLLKELCFRQIDYYQGLSHPTVQYRPGSRSYNHVRESAERQLQTANPSSERHQKEDWRRKALAETAKKIIETSDI